MISCLVCGGSSFSKSGSASRRLFVRCDTCRAEGYVEGFALNGAEADASPCISEGSGAGEDPWVWFRVRMKQSQRRVIHEAMALVRDKSGLRSQWAANSLEMVAADFLAGRWE